MTREEAINFLKGYLDEEVYTEKCRNAHEMAIKALEQETVSKESYDHEYFLRKGFELKIDELQRQREEQAVKAKSIFDKIRAEIETKYGQCDICEYFENYDYEENDISEYRPIGNIADILQIIDKWIAESEG